MKLLAIETSQPYFSLAITDNDAIVESFTCVEQQKPAETILMHIERMLEAQKISYQQLDAIAVCTGPGTFTGIRIGTATAKALAMACDANQVGVTSFEAWAENYYATHEGKLLVALDARRDEFYVQTYTSFMTPEEEPILMGHSQCQDYIRELIDNDYAIIGTCDHIDGMNVTKSYTLTAQNVARIAYYKLKNSLKNSTSPLYIRPPDAKISASNSLK